LHVTSSVGWLGAVVAYVVLVVAALRSGDSGTVRSIWTALEVTGWYAVVPLALTALFTGLIGALCTVWGLFRHYWVVFKLLLTTVTTAILLVHMPSVSLHVSGAASGQTSHLGQLEGELLHAGGGLAVLLVTAVLGIYKPRGLTPYGWRKQQEARDRPA